MEKSRRHKQIEIVAADMFKRFAADRKTIVDYDERTDVLYVNFTSSPIKRADYTFDTGDYVFRFNNGKLIGITIVDASLHFAKQFKDVPFNPSIGATAELVAA